MIRVLRRDGRPRGRRVRGGVHHQSVLPNIPITLDELTRCPHRAQESARYFESLAGTAKFERDRPWLLLDAAECRCRAGQYLEAERLWREVIAMGDRVEARYVAVAHSVLARYLLHCGRNAEGYAVLETMCAQPLQGAVHECLTLVRTVLSERGELAHDPMATQSPYGAGQQPRDTTRAADELAALLRSLAHAETAGHTSFHTPGSPDHSTSPSPEVAAPDRPPASPDVPKCP